MFSLDACLVWLFLILIDHGLDDQQKLETKANIMTLGNYAHCGIYMLCPPIY